MAEGHRRRRLAREDRRGQLLDVAVELAAGRDVTAVSAQEIAARAGVSEGLLYHYFPTKQALLLAAVRRAAEAMTAALDAAAGGPPLPSLAAGLAAYLDHVQAEPTGWKAVLQARTGELAEVGAAVDAHARGLVLAGLGVRDPSPALLMALNGWAALEREACLAWLEHPQLPRAAVEDLLMTTFLQALEAAARHDERTREVLARIVAGG